MPNQTKELIILPQDLIAALKPYLPSTTRKGKSYTTRLNYYEAAKRALALEAKTSKEYEQGCRYLAEKWRI